MSYCSYPEYQSAGGLLPEEAFAVFSFRAGRLIDRLTFGRAGPHCSECAACRTSLTDACIQLVDLMAAQAALGSAPGAVSVSNDGLAVSFSGNAGLEAQAGILLANALGADPHGLLYRGCF
ncbi:MAG: hypothetical protein ACI4JC_02725 [Faecalibacterium sp.]